MLTSHLLPQIEELIQSDGAAAIQAMKDEVEGAIAQFDVTIAQLRAELAELEAALPKASEPTAPKFDPEKHPLLKKPAEDAETAQPIRFNPGDLCEARWTDRQWYKAKVQTVMGSSAAPKYLVRFVDYDETMTVDRDAVRPLYSERKRKAESALAPPTAPPAPVATPTTSSPHVISGPASLNPEAMAKKKDPEIDTSVPINRRKIGSKKALERKANAWESFISKGPGKKIVNKDSMFRSGTSVGSKGKCATC
jgi:survival of motor neuron-related-splicing factor 30